jgi:hypothetical protein
VLEDRDSGACRSLLAVMNETWKTEYVVEGATAEIPLPSSIPLVHHDICKI